MDIVYFCIKYTPFWAVPVIMLSGEFAMNFWFRGQLSAFLLSGMSVGFCVLSVVFYYWAGGPVLAVEAFKDFIGIFRL